MVQVPLNLFIFLLGTVIGSFINTCIYRIPRGKSVAYPPSYCPQCGYNLKPADLIPIFSYLLLKGKCRKCREAISGQYILVEILTGFMFTLAFIKFGLTIEFLIAAVLITSLIISAFIDLKYQVIPDKVVLTTFIMGLLLNILINKENILYHLMGFALGGGTIFLIVVLSRGGMGGGDIKLFAAVGIFLGFRLTALALLLSFILGSFAGIVLVLLKRKKINDAIPFGPFIALASVISLFVGEKILAWYLGLF